MTVKCENSEMLAMAYLDGELASEERRELELHCRECAGCRNLLVQETKLHEVRVAMLAAPPPPDLLRQRVGRALDEVDTARRKAQRMRWVLPGSAVAAAAAALFVFVGGMAMPMGISTQATQAGSPPPVIEAERAGTALPRRSALKGVRPTSFLDQPAAQTFHEINTPRGRVVVVGYVLEQAPRALSEGLSHVIAGRRLFLASRAGVAEVRHTDANGVGYVFASTLLSPADLLAVVVEADLITQTAATP